MENAGRLVTFDRSPDPGVINLGIGQPSPDLLPVELIRAVTDELLAKAAPLDLNYGEPQGDAGFRAALAGLLGAEYRHPVRADDLFVTAGNSQALDFVCGRFARPGDAVFIEEPSYFLAHRIFADHGLEIVGIPMDRDGLRIDVLEDELKRRRPALLYTIPSYHNPLGRTLSERRRVRLARLSREHGFVVVADEVYQMLYYGDRPPPAMGTLIDRGNILSLGSFSKIMAPGLRLGWIQTAPELMQRILAAGVVNSGGSFNQFTSLVMREAIESGRQQAMLEKLRPVYRSRLETMDQALQQHLGDRAGWQRPDGGYFFWLEFDAGLDTADLRRHAAEFGVGFQPGEVFSCRRGLRNCLRLSFAHYRRDDVERGVARLARLLQSRSEP